METDTLTCNSCGAPLDVPCSAKFVTCNHCSTQLAIRRSDSTTFTEQLNHLVEKTEQLSSRLDDLTTQNELAALDREWELKREDFIVSGNDGHPIIPTVASSIIGGVMITVFGSVWTAMAGSITAIFPPWGPFGIAKVAFPLFGVLFIIGGIATSIVSCSKAIKHREAERRYHRRRNELKGGDSND